MPEQARLGPMPDSKSHNRGFALTGAVNVISAPERMMLNVKPRETIRLVALAMVENLPPTAGHHLAERLSTRRAKMNLAPASSSDERKSDDSWNTPQEYFIGIKCRDLTLDDLALQRH